MAIQDDIMRAKYNAQSNIPVYVVPDSYSSSYASTLLPAMSQLVSRNINSNPQSGYAPGSKTLGGKSFEEDKRATAIAETLAKQKFDYEKQDTDRKFDFNVMDSNRRFTQDQLDSDRSYALALQKAYSSGSSAGTPSTRENFQAVKNGAISLLKDLMNPTSSGEEGAQGFYQEGLSPQEAVQETINKVNSQLDRMDLTESEYNSLINMIYYSAGLTPPSKEKNNNDSFMQELYG